MPPRLSCCRRLAMAAGLACLLPATAARAQSAYGYDSFLYGTPPPQTFWYGAGFQSMYTDPSTGVYANGTLVPDPTAVPNLTPPYGLFGRFNGLPPVAPLPARVAAPLPAAPVPQPVVKSRKSVPRRRR